MLTPLTAVVLTPAPYNLALAVPANEPDDSVVARTAGALHTDQPFPGYEEEREAAARAMVEDMVAESEN